jgi:nitrogen regulatory protein P-II 1
MKKVEAIIRTSKFEEVKQALHEIDINFFTYSDTTGVGNEKNMEKHMYRGTAMDTGFIPRKVLEIVVRDQNVRKTVDCILKVAYTGEIGDGRIFVTPVDESWKIRTKQSGDETLKGEGEK